MYGCPSCSIKKAECQRIGNQPWIFIGRTDAEAETLILGPPDVKSWLTGKDADPGKDWGKEEMTQHEMIGCHYRLNGHEFEQTPGYSQGQENLACCRLCSHRDTWLNDWTTATNQSILKEINPEYSVEGLMLKLKLQYFGHLMQRADSLEKMLILGKIEGRRRWHSMRWLDVITDSMDMSLSKLQDIVRDRKTWHAAICAVTEIHDWMTEQQQQTSQS